MMQPCSQQQKHISACFKCAKQKIKTNKKALVWGGKLSSRAVPVSHVANHPRLKRSTALWGKFPVDRAVKHGGRRIRGYFTPHAWQSPRKHSIQNYIKTFCRKVSGKCPMTQILGEGGRHISCWPLDWRTVSIQMQLLSLIKRDYCNASAITFLIPSYW